MTANIVISFLTAFITTLLAYSLVLKLAVKYNIVDNPDARKLQRTPVPVLGGVAVFFGIFAASVLTYFGLVDNGNIEGIFLAMFVMLVVGTVDDIHDLSPMLRFAIEIAITLFLIYVVGIRIDNVYGMWHLGVILSPWIYLPLTIIAAVGIINSINLIDGVDGLSSGFGNMACIMFGIMYCFMGNQVMAILAFSIAGALIPFFLHNVFGKTSKMFIGDGGTLMLGTAMSVFVLDIFTTNSVASLQMQAHGVCLPAFSLAVLSIPVFDTLRVMSTRILRGHSPFRPDKTHLHHLFIEMGFSHVGTTVGLITTDFLIVVIWYLSYRCGASINLQLHIVAILAFLITFVFYPFVKFHQKRNTALYQLLLSIGKASHLERKGFWAWMRKTLDKKVEKKKRNVSSKVTIL